MLVRLVLLLLCKVRTSAGMLVVELLWCLVLGLSILVLFLEYDEDVVTRYKLMSPSYVFQHWWELLQGENRYAKTKYNSKEFYD